MAQNINKVKPSEVILYTDLPEQSCNGGTIPADIIQSLQRPDIVLINRLDIRYLRYRDIASDLRSNGSQAERVEFKGVT